MNVCKSTYFSFHRQIWERVKNVLSKIKTNTVLEQNKKNIQKLHSLYSLALNITGELQGNCSMLFL